MTVGIADRMTPTPQRAADCGVASGAGARGEDMVSGVTRQDDQRDDQGAAAVEFALVSVLLFTLLFGILQYGYGFFQMQATAATAGDAARLAVAGLYDVGGVAGSGCVAFGNAVADAGEGNGLPSGAVQQVKVTWRDLGGGATAQRGGTAIIQVTVEPTDLNYPFVPFPATITRSMTAMVENVGDTTTTCTVNL
jgi:Flp pilus assembly protein TadG